MKPKQFTNRESRYLPQSVELRMEEDGNEVKKKVRGYAAKFNVDSENLGSEDHQFIERIAPGAFDEVLNDDVRALFNHDANAILARSKGGKGSMRLWVDEIGLGYEFEAPDTQAGRDLLASIERGDVDQSSFSFTVSRDGQEWTESRDGDGPTITRRTINKVKRLFDVSPVTYPAYPDATVALRSLQEFREESKPEHAPEPEKPQESHTIDHWQRKIDLLDKPAAK